MEQNDRRILVFSFAYYPHEGGAEIAARKIIEHNQDISFDVLTYSLKRGDKKREEFQNARVFRIRAFSRYLFPFAAFYKAIKLHRKNRYHKMWIIMANYAGFAGLFFNFFHREIPYLLTLQEGDPISHIKKRVGFLHPLFKKIFTRASHIQVISKYLAGFAREMGYKGDISVIANGVDEGFFIKNPSWPRHSEEEKILITTSRLVKKNAVDDIISAVEYLPKNIKLYVLGDGSERKNLETLVQDKKLAGRVVFYGNVLYEKLPEYLEKADVYVRPSRSEGLGSAFLEAQAVGLPVIGTNVGGIPDIISHEETGFLCKVDDPKSIAEAVQFILDEKNKMLVERVVQNAHASVNNYRWEKIASLLRFLL